MIGELVIAGAVIQPLDGTSTALSHANFVSSWRQPINTIDAPVVCGHHVVIGGIRSGVRLPAVGGQYGKTDQLLDNRLVIRTRDSTGYYPATNQSEIYIVSLIAGVEAYLSTKFACCSFLRRQSGR